MSFIMKNSSVYCSVSLRPLFYVKKKKKFTVNSEKLHIFARKLIKFEDNII